MFTEGCPTLPRPRALALFAAAPAPSMIDLAGRALLVVGVFVLVLCAMAALPGLVDWVRREVDWRRFERAQRRPR